MTTDTQIFYMTENDIKRVAEIEKECIINPWSEKSFITELQNKSSAMLVAKTDGVITGFLTASVVLDEVSINNVAVTAEYRNKGIAHMLLQQLESIVKDTAAFITLEVRESNINAISVYSSCGYKNVGMRRNFYTNPVENAVLMTKFFV